MTLKGSVQNGASEFVLLVAVCYPREALINIPIEANTTKYTEHRSQYLLASFYIKYFMSL